MHSSAVAATSEPHRALVSGGLAESTTRSAELPDIEPEDFVRFLEYAYRGNYTVPSWTHDESLHALDNTKACTVPQSPPSQAPRPELDFTGLSKSQKRKLMLEIASERAILDTSTAKPDPHAALTEGYNIKPNAAACQDYTPVFLAHARLYSFADMRLCASLKELALCKLRGTLGAFELYPERVRDVVELVRYAYENGPDRNKKGVPNDLRELVVVYVADEVKTVGSDREFKALLEEGGEFVGDFWGLVLKRCV